MRNKIVVTLVLLCLVIVSWVWRRVWITWLFLSRAFQWFLLCVFPKLKFPTRGIRKTRLWDGWHLLRKGDILITKSAFGLPSLLTPGYDHAALCVDDSTSLDKPQIAEMTAKGFDVVTWEKFGEHSRQVLICRCDDWDESYKEEVVKKCLSMKGLEYDTEFEMNNGRLTCAELVVESDFENRLKVQPGTAVGIGRKFVSPKHILDAENLSVIWNSKT